MRRNCLLLGTVFIWCLIFVSSCTSRVSEAPKIDFINPSLNLVDLPQELNVDVMISDDIQLKDYQIWLTSSTGLEYFYDKVNLHSDFHRIAYAFDLSSATDSKFTIRVVVKDHDGNKTVSIREFTIDK